MELTLRNLQVSDSESSYHHPNFKLYCVSELRFCTDIDVKKGARGRPRARARPPSMSLSQGFSSVGRRAISHSVGAVGRPLNSTKVPGMSIVQPAITESQLDNFPDDCTQLCFCRANRFCDGARSCSYWSQNCCRKTRPFAWNSTGCSSPV